jgi:hypothetical protein
MKRGNIADEFTLGGVQFKPAQKVDRLTGRNSQSWILASCRNPDVFSLYLARTRKYFWAPRALPDARSNASR